MLLEALGIIIKYLLLAMCGWAVLSFIFGQRRTFAEVKSRWHHTFSEMTLSPKEFYAAVADLINKKQIADVEMDTVTHSERGYLSSSRAYLQVVRHDHLILVCAAPFGTEFFVSWWYGTPSNAFDELIERVPFVGKYLYAAKTSKTFYQMDSDDMFKDIIKECVMEVIDKIGNDKGKRMLSDSERMPIDSRLTTRLM